MRVSLWSILALTLVGCSPATEKSAIANTSTDSVVNNSVPSWSNDDEWRVPEEARLTIGEESADSELVFSRISSMIRLSDERIIVADGPPASVRVFSPTGEFLNHLGTVGEGPGEFLDACCLTVMNDSLIGLFDSRLSRFSLFEPEGDFIAQNSIGPRDQFRFSAPVGFLGGATLIVREEPLPRPSTRGVVFRDTTVLYRADVRLSGDRIELGDRQRVTAVPGPQLYAPGSGPPRATSLPFGRRGAFATSSSGVAFCTGDTWEITLMGLSGTHIKFTRDWNQREVTRATWEAEKDSLIAHPPGSGPGQAPPPEAVRRFYDDLFSEMPKPEAFPPTDRLLIDSEGNVWAHNADPNLERSWSVFRPTGEYLGDVTMPPRFTPLQIGDDWVLGTTESEIGSSLVRLHGLSKN